MSTKIEYDGPPLDLEDNPAKTDPTPVNYPKLAGQDTGKVVGTIGNDKATLFDFTQDKDQIINLGAGDDVFVFGAGDDSGSASRINGILEMGAGGTDKVYLTHSIEDYRYDIRSDGGIKIHYTHEDGNTDGAAITFRGADLFIFRNVAEDGSGNYVNLELTYQQLVDAITAGHYPPV